MEQKNRPDPDKLLASIKANEQRKRSRLKIFFGMCAGVGKTYAMLHEAGELRRDGHKVKVGYVEMHDRPETKALLKGLQVYSRGRIEYRGKQLEEFDLDAVLKDKPEIVLVDELAHTNAPGSRHPKRYQDVFELLDNGITVYTTLNVQHLDSINEDVRAATGVSVHETIPDEVLDRADEIELVDLTPAELLKRLAEGKVYTPDQSKTAIANFFTVPNLTALREQALRVTRGHVQGELDRVHAAGDRGGQQRQNDAMLLLITPNESAEQAIRRTRQSAYNQGCRWGVAVIDNGRRMRPAAEQQLTRNIQLARDLGGEVLTAKSGSVASGLLQIARQDDFGRLVVLNPGGRGLLSWLRSAWLHLMLHRNANVDLIVLRNPDGTAARSPYQPYREISVDEYLMAVYGVLFAVLVGLFVNVFMGYYTVALVFLTSIIVLSLMVSRGAILFAALLSAVLWDVLFIPPRFHFTIGKTEDVLMLGMYVLTAIVVGTLTGRARQNELLNRQHEDQLSSLLKLSQRLVSARTIDDISSIAMIHLRDSFKTRVCIYLATKKGELSPQPHRASDFIPDEKELGVASWAYMNRKAAGKFTTTLAGTDIRFIPLATDRGNYGIIGIDLAKQRTFTFEEETLVNGAVQQLVAAVERVRLIGLH